MSVLTAARLSASFPYVSPIAEPDHADLRKDIQGVADGGYSDNEGIVTAIECINELDRLFPEADDERAFDRILLLRISHEPKARSAQQSSSTNGLLTEVIGPLLTMFAVRSTSQAERGNLEAELVERLCRTSNTPVEVATLSFKWGGEDGSREVPLNWKLSPKQKCWYDDSWNSSVADIAENLDRYFQRRRREDPPPLDSPTANAAAMTAAKAAMDAANRAVAAANAAIAAANAIAAP